MLVTNLASAITGTADLWGLNSPNDRHSRVDLRAAGVQALDVDSGRIAIFAIHAFRGSRARSPRSSTP